VCCEQHTVDVKGLPDNFYISDDGRIFVAVHPYAIRFLQHARVSAVYSFVVRVLTLCVCAQDPSHKAETMILELVGSLGGPTRQLKSV
jgi:hypothetical protein